MRFKTTILLLLFYTLMPGPVQATESLNTLDSLYRNSVDDSTRIELLLKKGDVFEHTDYHLALDYYHQALEYCITALKSNKKESMKLNVLHIKALRYIAFLQSNWQHYDLATQTNEQLLDLYHINKDDKGVCNTLNRLGNIYYYQGNWAVALGYYQDGLVQAEKSNIKQLTADLQTNIATIHYLKGDYLKSLEHYQQALFLYDSLDNKNNKGIVYLGMGNIHNSMGNFNHALTNYQTALQYFEQTEDYDNISSIHISLGSLYYLDLEYDEAEKYYLLALNHCVSANNSRQESECLVNLGILYESKGDTHQSLEYLNKALVVSRTSSNKFIETVSLRNIALGLSKSGSFQKALHMAQQSLQLAKEIDSLEDQAEGYKILAEINKKRQAYQDALHYYQEYKTLNDSLLNIEKQRQLNEMDAIFQSERKERQIALQQLELDKNKIELRKKNHTVNIIIILLISLVFIAIIVFVYNNKEKLKNQDIKRQNQIINHNLNRIKVLEKEKIELNKQIKNMSHQGKSIEQTRYDQIQFARYINQRAFAPQLDLQQVFPGKSFTYPYVSNAQTLDYSFIKEDAKGLFMAIADTTLDVWYKNILHIAMNSFLERNITSLDEIDTTALSVQLNDFVMNILQPHFEGKTNHSLKLSFVYINAQTKKIKYVSKGMWLYFAIARNQESFLKKDYEYHELQKLTAKANRIADSMSKDPAREEVEFTLKTTDRIYIINPGFPANAQQSELEEFLCDAYLIPFIDSYQNMKIDLLGQYLRKELRIQASKGNNYLPDQLSIRGIEL